MTAYTKYGTVEFYEEQFSDILAEIDADNPQYANAIFEGFMKAIDSWFIYHDHQATAYDELRQRVRKALTV